MPTTKEIYMIVWMRTNIDDGGEMGGNDDKGEELK